MIRNLMAAGSRLTWRMPDPRVEAVEVATVAVAVDMEEVEEDTKEEVDTKEEEEEADGSY
jgi:hypothetical protein